jgi:hypothetical protein
MSLFTRIGDAMLERLAPQTVARAACVSCSNPGGCSGATIEQGCFGGRYHERCCLYGGACGSYSCGAWRVCGGLC